MADQEVLDPAAAPALHLLSAFLAMEPGDSLLSLARACGGGSLTETVQRFVWDHLLKTADGNGCAPYMKKFLKKLIMEIESNHGNVLDELYEQYASYMTSLKDDNIVKENARICKCLSFLFPSGCSELQSCARPRKLIVPLQCSLNMLEGDTGCSIWPSSLFLSELILSFPDIFSEKSCFEVGSGVGLVGICLAHVKAPKVILSDGDLSTLANMKLNLEMNQLNTETTLSETTSENPRVVKCIHLPWESVSESELQDYMPDIILGADVIYDPTCLPHLVRVLAILLKMKSSFTKKSEEGCENPSNHIKANGVSQGKDPHLNGLDRSNSYANSVISSTGPMAYIATVIRNIDTFNHFLELANQADLTVADLTGVMRPLDLLPYMQSYDRSTIRLFSLSCK
ncbi:hypothetical protein SLE2022_127030 [Rubroshorea leprosula]